MNAQQIQKKLEYMKGATYDYAGQLHLVQSYIVDEADEQFEIKTNLNRFKRKFESADNFFKYWTISKNVLAVQKVSEGSKENEILDEEVITPAVYMTESNLADELVSILKDNIKKVQGDAKYINQAQSINNNVNSILRVQALKLGMMKQMEKFSGKNKKS
jgi:hypothetical protein